MKSPCKKNPSMDATGNLLLKCRPESDAIPFGMHTSICLEAEPFDTSASDESSIFEFSAISSTSQRGSFPSADCDGFVPPLSAVITRYISQVSERTHLNNIRSTADACILLHEDNCCNSKSTIHSPASSSHHSHTLFEETNGIVLALPDSQTDDVDSHVHGMTETLCNNETLHSSSALEVLHASCAEQGSLVSGCDSHDYKIAIIDISHTCVDESIPLTRQQSPGHETLVDSSSVSSMSAPIAPSSECSVDLLLDAPCQDLINAETNGRLTSDLKDNRRFLTSSPLLFSEDEDCENFPSNEKTKPCLDNSRTVLLEKRRLKQIQESLIGVVPPPSVTIPQFGVDDFLSLLGQNYQLVCHEKTDQKESTALRNEATECRWPEVKACCYFGVHYNNGASSEEFESLTQRFSARFVGSETASTCTVWANSAAGGSTRNKRGAGPSPGRRLSHLARRRRAFSRDNLLNNAASHNQHSSAPERRQIVVQHNKRIAQGQTGKLPTKALPHKRALFQSPDETRKKLPAAKSGSSSKRKARSAKPATSGQSFKRALFSSASKDKDKASGSGVGLQDASSSGGSRLASSSKRKLVFPSSADVQRASGSAPNEGQTSLSSPHRKKLLWAVAEALRGLGIGMSHTLFRPCASTLARLCRHQLGTISLAGSTTTELMTQLANQHAANVVKEKTVERAE